MDQREIGDMLADEGHPLKRRTILDAAKGLEDQGLIERKLRRLVRDGLAQTDGQGKVGQGAHYYPSAVDIPRGHTLFEPSVPADVDTP